MRDARTAYKLEREQTSDDAQFGHGVRICRWDNQDESVVINVKPRSGLGKMYIRNTELDSLQQGSIMFTKSEGVRISGGIIATPAGSDWHLVTLPTANPLSKQGARLRITLLSGSLMVVNIASLFLAAWPEENSDQRIDDVTEHNSNEHHSHSYSDSSHTNVTKKSQSYNTSKDPPKGQDSKSERESSRIVMAEQHWIFSKLSNSTSSSSNSTNNSTGTSTNSTSNTNNTRTLLRLATIESQLATVMQAYSPEASPCTLVFVGDCSYWVHHIQLKQGDIVKIGQANIKCKSGELEKYHFVETRRAYNFEQFQRDVIEFLIA